MRRVVNCDALEPVLAEYDITAVRLKERSVTEQVRLFCDNNGRRTARLGSRTSSQIGTHRRLPVRDDHHPVYYAMSEQLNHEFACLARQIKA
jgi:hypothetical protein